MRAISESELQNCLDSGSTKRFHSYQKRLLQDNDKPIYDDRAVGLLMRYCTKPKLVQSELRYLKNLKGEDGLPFCRSIRRYADMESQWEGFLKPEKGSFLWNSHCIAAVERVQKRYLNYTHKLNALVYRSDEDIHDAVTDWTTATGWTYVLTGAKHKVDVLSGVFNRWKSQMAEATRIGTFNSPILCATRTQASGAYDIEGNRTNTCKHKTRAVNMVDVYQIISESIWGKPMNERVKRYSYSAIGKSDVEVGRWVYARRSKYRSWISFDYSKYDSTIPSWLLRKAFEILKACFNASEYDALWELVVNDFIHKNIVTGNSVIHVDHGNPSGSRFTALVNGVCNELITETWMHKFGISGDYMIMGDDNLVYVDVAVSPDLIAQICDYISHNFGIKTNADKTTFGTRFEDPEFMSRFWRIDGPDRCLGDVISLLAYPERFRNYAKKDTQLRPELVVFSYVLCYPIAMRQIMDVDQFLKDTNLTIDKIPRTKEALADLPYSLRTYLEIA